MKDISRQMQALDDFVTRARSQNAQHHDSHTKSLEGLSGTVISSYSNIGSHFTSTYERVRDLGDDMSMKATSLQESLTPLESILRQPLAELRSNISSTLLQEYQPTGETPQKIQYQYPTNLPRTEAHATLLAALRRPLSTSPTKTMIPVVFNDNDSRAGGTEVTPPSTETERKPTGGLREIDVNIHGGAHNADLLQQNGSSAPGSANSDSQPHIPAFKRSTSATGKLPLPKSAKKAVIAMEGRENSIVLFSQSTGRRRSPRTG
jgi:kinesin family protein 11